MKYRPRKHPQETAHERAINYYIPQAERVADKAVRETFRDRPYISFLADALWNRAFHLHMDKTTTHLRTKGPRCRNFHLTG